MSQNQPFQIGQIEISEDTRLGRMLSAGRLTATVKSKRSGEHMTLTLTCSAKIENRWQHVPFAEATHVFITQGPGGYGAPKIGTYYPKTGKLYIEPRFVSPSIPRTLAGLKYTPWGYSLLQALVVAPATGVLETNCHEISEANLCGTCGKELTDPVSIERGIGPTCFGKSTGSKHYKKERTLVEDLDPATHHQRQVARRVLQTNDVMNAVLGGPSREEAESILKDKKGRNVPRTFEALAAAVNGR